MMQQIRLACQSLAGKVKAWHNPQHDNAEMIMMQAVMTRQV